jgi:protein-S-isoprenylcysteine O-methyltransferase Ste14
MYLKIYIELKVIEEPELEMRLGDVYREYKKKVPMFFPRFPFCFSGK